MSHRSSGSPRVAAIDIGTNSVRLLVAERGAEGEVRPLVRLGESCRLGEGLEATGRIPSRSEDRTRETLARFARRARELECVEVIVAATNALRSAGNGPEVTHRLSEAAGYPIRILSGEEEARLVYRAVIEGLRWNRDSGEYLVVDIGGGSVEIVRGLGNREARWVSLELGCVRLTDRFLTSDPPSPDQLASLRSFLRTEWVRQDALLRPTPQAAAGVGGTVTALAALNLGLRRYDASRVEGHLLPTGDIRRLTDSLSGLTTAERQALATIGPGRADILPAGCVLLVTLCEAAGLASLTASTQGLRYALARAALARAENRRFGVSPTVRGAGAGEPGEWALPEPAASPDPEADPTSALTSDRPEKTGSTGV
ncbi:MAG: Ppx/GppA family phosphatase [Candidatus Eiseniibacteriota bacterium]